MMKRVPQLIQNGLTHLLAFCLLAAGYASGCTATYNSRDNHENETTRTTGTSVVIRTGDHQ